MNVTTVKLGVDSRDVKGARKELDGMQSAAQKAETATMGLGKALAAIAASAALYKITQGLTDAVNRASDLQEAMSKFDTVFSYHADQARDWSRTLTESYAMSKRESVEYLGSIQDLLVPMGMASEEAAKLSFEVVKLAADLGSFNNQLTSKVIDDYQSALVGNYETMKKYGVVLNATVVQQRALDMGLAKTASQLTASDKAFAAHKIIVEGSSAAIGDMIRTSGGYANTTKDLDARWEDFAATLGGKFLDSATRVKSVTADILENLTKAIEGPSLDDQIKATQDRINTLESTGKNIEKTSEEFAASEEQRIERLRQSWSRFTESRESAFRGSVDLANAEIPGPSAFDPKTQELSIEKARLLDLKEKKRVETLEEQRKKQEQIASEQAKIEADKLAAFELSQKKAREADLEMATAFSDRMRELEHATAMADIGRSNELIDQLDQLRASIDPAYAAALELDDALAGISRLAEAGLIGEDEFNRMANGFIKVSKAAGGIGSNLESNAASMQEGLQISQRLFDQQSREFKAIEVAIQAANVARAIGAILNQAAGGDPYTAFARMLCMGLLPQPGSGLRLLHGQR